MPKSMTGFGGSSVSASFGSLTAEIQSINRKHLEIVVHLPKELSRFENAVRKWISPKISRGQVTVRLYFAFSQDGASHFFPDVGLLRSLKQGWEKICNQVDLDSKEINIQFLTDSLPPTSRKELLKDEDLPLLQGCIDEALTFLLMMKEMEGEALIEDIQKRLALIQKMTLIIEKSSSGAQDRLREKLLAKLKELFPNDQTIDERVAREIALFAEKGDITEELIRLKSHFLQFKECFATSGPVGRKMEFVLQEIFREVNTIGSKSPESLTSTHVIEIKAELERIREQIQNIE